MGSPGMGSHGPSRARALTAGILLLALVSSSAAGCGKRDGGVALPIDNPTTITDATSSDVPTATTTTAPPASTTTPAPSSTTTRPPPAAGGPGPGVPGPPAGSGCPGGHPTTGCTGVPAGTRLTALNGHQEIRTPGTVIDGRHITGDVLVLADNVTIRNSQIDGGVFNERDGRTYSFTIHDSTIGPASGCNTLPAVGEARYTAARLHIRGHGDGFRVSGPDVVARDSYVKLCSNPGDHSDGVQDYPGGSNVLIQNNTFDQRNAPSHTAPILINNTDNLRVIGNLLIGGTWTISVLARKGGPVWVQNNMVVDGSWDFGPADANCGVISWSGNSVVTINAGYGVTSVVRPLPCG